MYKALWAFLSVAAITNSLSAQETYVGAGSIGAHEPLFRYDDQENWKHGYLQIMPYYHGYHSYRPYNYHHVFNQSQTAAGWGMSPVMPYSQQFWHRYEAMTDLSGGDHSLVVPNEAPIEEDSHYPKPIGSGAMWTPEIRPHIQPVAPTTISPVQYQQGWSGVPPQETPIQAYLRAPQ